MKRATSVLCAVILLMAMFTALAVPAEAADMEFTFRGTVNEMAYFILISNAYDEILDAKIYNGVVPGMTLDVAGGATLGLVGTPTTDGEFTVFLTVTTRNEGELDLKATVTIEPGAGEVVSGTPTVTKNPTGETVVEGDSAVFIARADNVRQYVWVIGIADAEIDCTDLESYIGKGIKVSGYDSERLELHNIPMELNDAYVWCRFIGAEKSVTSAAARIAVIAQKDAVPVVTKHPTDETVQEGGEAVFVAKANYAQSYRWQMVSPDGVRYDCAEASKTFPGLKVSGADSERITLSNIPLELDGYRICCKFTAGDVVSSDFAKLYVTADPAATEASTEAATVPTTEATEEATRETEAEKPTTQKPQDNKNKSEPEKANRSNNALIIVAIICAAIVAVAGITAFVILKLKGPKKN